MISLNALSYLNPPSPQTVSDQTLRKAIGFQLDTINYFGGGGGTPHYKCAWILRDRFQSTATIYYNGAMFANETRAIRIECHKSSSTQGESYQMTFFVLIRWFCFLAEWVQYSIDFLNGFNRNESSHLWNALKWAGVSRTNMYAFKSLSLSSSAS